MEEIREGLSGNLCRCTGYSQIFEAVVGGGAPQGDCMRSNPSDYEMVAPGSLQAIVSLLAEEPGKWLPIAGGTDLMVQYAAGKLTPRKLVSIWNLPELRRIEVTPNEIRIGAGCTYTDVRRHEVVAREFPLLAECRSMDRRNREPESRNNRRQYRERIAGSGFLARTARVRSGIGLSVSSRRTTASLCFLSHWLQKDFAGAGRTHSDSVPAAAILAIFQPRAQSRSAQCAGNFESVHRGVLAGWRMAWWRIFALRSAVLRPCQFVLQRRSRS